MESTTYNNNNKSSTMPYKPPRRDSYEFPAAFKWNKKTRIETRRPAQWNKSTGLSSGWSVPSKTLKRVEPVKDNRNGDTLGDFLDAYFTTGVTIPEAQQPVPTSPPKCPQLQPRKLSCKEALAAMLTAINQSSPSSEDTETKQDDTVTQEIPTAPTIRTESPVSMDAASSTDSDSSSMVFSFESESGTEESAPSTPCSESHPTWPSDQDNA